MELVVVATEAVEDGLLWGGLVANDPVRLAVLGGLLRLRRAGDALGEVGAGRFCAEVEGRALRSGASEGRMSCHGERAVRRACARRGGFEEIGRLT